MGELQDAVSNKSLQSGAIESTDRIFIECFRLTKQQVSRGHD